MVGGEEGKSKIKKQRAKCGGRKEFEAIWRGIGQIGQVGPVGQVGLTGRER